MQAQEVYQIQSQMQAPAVYQIQSQMQAQEVLKEEKWAIFTEFKPTGYISNGPYNFTEKRARELLLIYIKPEEEEEEKEKKYITKMWIQEKNTGIKLYINK